MKTESSYTLIPFDIDTWRIDTKVITRDNTPVRILCTDKHGNYPIVGLVNVFYDGDIIEEFDLKGNVKRNNINEPNDWDLFMYKEETVITLGIYKHCFDNTISVLIEDEQDFKDRTYQTLIKKFEVKI